MSSVQFQGTPVQPSSQSIVNQRIMRPLFTGKEESPSVKAGTRKNSNGCIEIAKRIVNAFITAIKEIFMQIRAYMGNKFQGGGTQANRSGSNTPEASTTTQNPETVNPERIGQLSQNIFKAFGNFWTTLKNPTKQVVSGQQLFEDMQKIANDPTFSKQNYQSLLMFRKTLQDPLSKNALNAYILNQYENNQLSDKKLLSILYEDYNEAGQSDSKEALHKHLTRLFKEKSPAVKENLYQSMRTLQYLGDACLENPEDPEALAKLNQRNLELVKPFVTSWQDVVEGGTIYEQLDSTGSLYSSFKNLFEEGYKANIRSISPAEMGYHLRDLYNAKQRALGKPEDYIGFIKLKNDTLDAINEDIEKEFSGHPIRIEKLQGITKRLAFRFLDGKQSFANFDRYSQRMPNVAACEFFRYGDLDSARKYAKILQKHTEGFNPKIVEIDLAVPPNSPEAQANKDQIIGDTEPGKLYTDYHNRIIILKNIEKMSMNDEYFRQGYQWISRAKASIDSQQQRYSFYESKKGNGLLVNAIAHNFFLIPIEKDTDFFNQQPDKNIIHALVNRC